MNVDLRMARMLRMVFNDGDFNGNSPNQNGCINRNYPLVSSGKLTVCY